MNLLLIVSYQENEDSNLFPKKYKNIYINHTLHIFKKKCTRMDRDPTFERASMRNKLLSGPRAHGTPSACHSPTRRGGRRALATVVCMPAPHRTPPAGPDPAARLASLVICVERRNGSQGDGATAGGSVATTAHLISHRTEAPRNPNPLRCPQASRLRRSFSSLWSGIRVPGGMAALSAGALAPLAGCNRSSLALFLPLIYRLSWLPGSLLFPNFLSFLGLSPLPWCSPAALYCRRSPPLLKVLYHQWL